MNWTDLLSEHGSMRRVMEMYWKGALSADAERFIETTVTPQIVIGYKPLEK